MIQPLAAIVKDTVYKGKYETANSEELQRLRVIPYGIRQFGHRPIVFLDTSCHGRNAEETLVGNGFTNVLEQRYIVDLCNDYEAELRSNNQGELSLSILSFYRAQTRAIRQQLGWPRFQRFKKLRFEIIDAIDKIQGQESDIVFITFCRARAPGHFGPGYADWLKDLRRLNVAFTRARRGLVLVGRLPTLAALDTEHEFYANLFKTLDSDKQNTHIVTQFGGRLTR